MAVKGRGRQAACVTHPDRSAVTRCVACHRPACEECVISTKDGKFCSRQCAAKTADFHTSKATLGKKAGLSITRYGKTIGGIIVLIVALAAVNRYIFHIPVIGRVLDKMWSKGKEVGNEVKGKVEDVTNSNRSGAPAESGE